METLTDFELSVERKRLLALIAKVPNSELSKIFPVVEAALSGRSNAKTSNRNTSRLAAAAGPEVVTSPAHPLRAQFRSTDKVCNEPRFKNGKPKLPLLPEGLTWPKKRYAKERKKTGCTIEQFLRSEWSALIQAGFGELRWLRIVDRSAASAIDYLGRRVDEHGQRRRLPEDIRFLTEREITDEKLAGDLSTAMQKDPRLAVAVASRLRRGTQIPAI